ncbi:MAG TPA: vWA domain-containing protein, partial [Pirellulaceae bacterium]|nr:vWA domain-containing protein [Pirellulaceae bacterium]
MTSSSHRVSLTIAAILALALLPGCHDVGGNRLRDEAQRQADFKNRKIARPKLPDQPKQQDAQDELAVIARAYQATRSGSINIGRAEDVAVKKVGLAIKASREIGPTLVVWIVDRTPSSQKIVAQATSAVKNYYDSQDVRQWSLSEDDPLLTAVIAYDETPELLLDPPTGDWQKVKAAWDGIQPSTAGRENTFAAIKQALEKYLTFRTDQRRELLLLVITDEAGDDPQLAEELAESTRRQAIPIYVIGSPAPWGQVNPFAADPKAIDTTKMDDSAPVHGPESLFSERVDIQGWAASYGFDSGQRPDFALIDSGFGPFALERLCRASRGQYFAIRPEAGSSAYSYRGETYQYWPPGNELRFTTESQSRYAPDYVSEAEYRQLLAENKARLALHEAARLPKVVVEDYPSLSFPKGTEAQNARNLNSAQQFAAKYAPAVDRLYNVLAPGEGDREKLTSPRWQAEFDLAMGRVLALKARLDGYNSMLAA